MVDALSDKLTLLIKSNVKDINDEKAEIINYGLKSIFSEVTKLSIILLIAYLLHILWLILIAISSFGLYRIFAGGAHADTHLKCFSTSSIIFFGTVYISLYLSPYLENFKIIYLMVFIFNCAILYYYAPADVAQKPIVSKKMRERLRMQSSFVMSLILVLSLSVIKDRTISSILIVTTLFESVSMLPFFYKISGCKYGATRECK